MGIYYEKVNSEEYLCVLDWIHPVGSKEYNISAAISLEKSKFESPYFKIYNNYIERSADKVARVKFSKPELVMNHVEYKGKEEWNIEDIDDEIRKELIDYLNSKCCFNLNVSVWDMLKYSWNRMRDFEFSEGIDDYCNGEYDEKYSENPDYVPYNLQMPDYLNLRNEIKGK